MELESENQNEDEKIVVGLTNYVFSFSRGICARKIEVYRTR